MSGFNPARSPQDVLPASLYLQERLQERRSRNTRPRRARHTDFGPRSGKGRDDDIFLSEAEATRPSRTFDSSPLAASTRGSDAGSTGGRRRALGVRDMDSQMDRLSKQNFALKLELDHRREQTLKMKEQMAEHEERAQALEDEHRELMRINTQLVEELEKRDKAVEEAMDIICDLEDKVATLEDRNSNTRPSTANADSGYAGTDTQEHEAPSPPSDVHVPPKTPRVNLQPPSRSASAATQKLQGLLNGQTPAKLRREPNILSQKKPSTHALRSVYLENTRGLHPVKSFHSLLSRHETRTEDELEDELNSPRLSTLSESSFQSIYSPKQHTSPDRFAWEAIEEEAIPSSAQWGPRSHTRQDSINRVSQWISEHDEVDDTPSKSKNISPPLLPDTESSMPPPVSKQTAHHAHCQSLNDALTSAAGKSPRILQLSENFNDFAGRTRKFKSSQQQRPTSFAGPIFGEPLLPPTPDSASTRMLRASRSSIADDRSLLDSTPAVVKGYDALVKTPGEPGVRTAPRQMRSSVEMRTAFASNLEYRNAVLDTLRHRDEADDLYEDGYTEAARDLGFDFDEFPDGKSIVTGTPRRLLKQPKSPVAETLYENQSFSPNFSQPQPRQRKSSDHFVSSALKPRLNRTETSPNMFGSLGKIVNGDKRSAESMNGSPSVRSGSSGNRTIVQAEETRSQGRSFEAVVLDPSIMPSLTSPTPSRTSASPARTLSQKTAILFRRLSNSHGSDRDKSLPILPSTPSSANANGTTDEPKRPMTSHGSDRPSTRSGPTQRPPSSHRNRRPSLQSRTKTEPPTARPDSSANEDTTSDRERKSLFRRSNSHKVPESFESNNKGAQPKRRGSLRDAVTNSRRPWR